MRLWKVFEKSSGPFHREKYRPSVKISLAHGTNILLVGFQLIDLSFVELTSLYRNSSMTCAEGWVLSIEYFTPIESSVLRQYKAAVILGGLTLMTMMACRVFRLLRLNSQADSSSSTVELSVIRYRMRRYDGEEMERVFDEGCEGSLQNSSS